MLLYDILRKKGFPEHVGSIITEQLLGFLAAANSSGGSYSAYGATVDTDAELKAAEKVGHIRALRPVVGVELIKNEELEKFGVLDVMLP